MKKKIFQFWVYVNFTADAFIKQNTLWEDE